MHLSQDRERWGLCGEELTKEHNFALSKLKAFTDDKLNVTQNINLSLIGKRHFGKRRKC